MIQINVMTSLHNRFTERNWTKDRGKHIYSRANRSIALVKEILVDASVDPMPQVEGLFHELLETMKSRRNPISDVFLPGGGDLPVPDFFRQYCEQHGIRIHLVNQENFREYIDFN